MRSILFILIFSTGLAFAFELLKDDESLRFLLWENNSESLAVSGQRGLGGGLEYQIENSFCEKIAPLFIEEMTCEELEQEIELGLSEWTKVQPKITFQRLEKEFAVVEHSQNLEYLDYDSLELGLIKANKVLPQNSEYSSHGAEIDFLTIDSWDHEIEDIAFFAYADLIWGDKQVKNLLGSKVKSANLLSTDIFFNTDPKICYHKAQNSPSELVIPSRCKKVLRFTFVVTHEVGHVLGLDHITENQTIMGRASDRDPIYHVTETDMYHLKRLYPSKEADMGIQNSHEDEFLKDLGPDLDYR